MKESKESLLRVTEARKSSSKSEIAFAPVWSHSHCVLGVPDCLRVFVDLHVRMRAITEEKTIYSSEIDATVPCDDVIFRAEVKCLRVFLDACLNFPSLEIEVLHFLRYFDRRPPGKACCLPPSAAQPSSPSPRTCPPPARSRHRCWGRFRPPLKSRWRT